MSIRLTAAGLTLIGAVTIVAPLEAAPKVVNACMITTNAKCPGVKLQGQDLAGANMSRSNLKGANLRGANLRKARFAGANLQGADFTGADVRGTNFSGANLRGAKFVRVKAGPPPGARSAGFRESALGANCDGSKQNTGANYSVATLTGATMTGSYMYANFNSATMYGVNGSGGNFSCTTFTKVSAESEPNVYDSAGHGCYSVYETNFAKASFEGADMNAAHILGWSLPNSSTVTSCSTGKSMTVPASYYPDLTQVNFQNANLTSASFHYTKLPATTSSLISGAVWSSTQCPQGNTVSGTPCTPTSP